MVVYLIATLLIVSPTVINALFSRRNNESPAVYSRRSPIIFGLHDSFIHRNTNSHVFNMRGGSIDNDGEHEDDPSISPDAASEDQVSENDLPYSSIGILDFCPNGHRPTILISVNSSDVMPEFSTESWCLRNEKSEAVDECSYLAAAETIGCLSHGIVLNLPIDEFSDKDVQWLDDVLFCIASGMIRRIKAGDEVTVPLMIMFGKKTERDQSQMKEHIQQYMDIALSRARSFIQKQSTETDAVLSPGVKVKVDISLTSPSEAATELSNASFRDAIDPSNLAPRPLFGILASKMHQDVCNRLTTTRNYGEATSVEWSIMPDKNKLVPNSATSAVPDNNTSAQQLSPDFQRKVESLMANLFVDAEESLREIETKIDEAFFALNAEETLDSQIPEFASDFDGVLKAISDSFFSLVNGDNTLTDVDREWAKAQRLVTLEQITRTSIHRLFHLHLQNLRDHFGQLYERCLDDMPAAECSTKSAERHRKEAARLSEEGFSTNAFNSIPLICRHPDGELCDEMESLYSCVEALKGLLEDMYEATSARIQREEEWEDIMTSDIETANKGSVTSIFRERIGLRELIKRIREERRKRGPAKWYERFAGKALILGVNYVQGWIVLQTLRREARKRDLDMPKFPLF